MPACLHPDAGAPIDVVVLERDATSPASSSMAARHRRAAAIGRRAYILDCTWIAVVARAGAGNVRAAKPGDAEVVRAGIAVLAVGIAQHFAGVVQDGCRFDGDVGGDVGLGFFSNIPGRIGNRHTRLHRAASQAQSERQTFHGLVIAKSSRTSLPSPEYALSDNFLPSIVKCT